MMSRLYLYYSVSILYGMAVKAYRKLELLVVLRQILISRAVSDDDKNVSFFQQKIMLCA